MLVCTLRTTPPIPGPHYQVLPAAAINSSYAEPHSTECVIESTLSSTDLKLLLVLVLHLDLIKIPV